MSLGLTSKTFAYGLDGLFGGSPNPDGTVTVDVPIQTQTEPTRAQSVLNHPRPDYDPTPLRLGSFVIHPSVEAGFAYNSNIYATPAPTSDNIFTAHPAVTATSDWGRHFLSMTANSDLDFYNQHSNQNFNTALVQLDGRYDIADQTWLAGRGGYQRQFVPRADLSNSTGSKPTAFNLYTAGASAYRGAGILRAQVDYDFSRFNYTNDPTASEQESIYNHNENRIGMKLVYAAIENLKSYISAQFNRHDYDFNSARSSQGTRTDIGATWDWGGITSFDFYTGWLSQGYASFGAQPVNQGLDYGGKLTWNVTGLTTFVLDGNRSIQDAQIDGYNSFMATGVSGTVTHELRRNLLLELDTAYTNDKYRGFSQRSDDIAKAGAGLRYLLNRNIYLDLAYSWNHRNSSVEGQGYVDHLVLAKIGYQF